MARLDVQLGGSLGLILNLIGWSICAGRLGATVIGQNFNFTLTVPAYSNHLRIQTMRIFRGQVNSALSSSITILF